MLNGGNGAKYIDGGSAYPDDAGDDPGMSFRDACALAALPSALAGTSGEDTVAEQATAAAEKAYLVADAMLRARFKMTELSSPGA